MFRPILAPVPLVDFDLETDALVAEVNRLASTTSPR